MTLIKTEVVTNHLRKLSDLYIKQDSVSRASAFGNAANSIQEVYKEYLPEDLKQILNIKGIGPSTMAEVKSVIETGTSPRLLELEKVIYADDSKVLGSIDKLKALLGKK